MPRTQVKTAPWVFGALAFSVAFSAFGVAFLSAVGRDWVFWGLVLLLVFFAIALLTAASTRIENEGDAIRIVVGLRTTRIAKSAIDKVSWEKGGGARLRLVDGTVVKLPATGRDEQAVANRVRSWLPRPE